MVKQEAAAQADGLAAADEMLAAARDQLGGTAGRGRRAKAGGTGKRSRPLWEGADIDALITWLKENAHGCYSHGGDKVTGFYIAKPEFQDDVMAEVAGLPKLRDEHGSLVGYAYQARQDLNERFQAVVQEAFDRMVRRGTVMGGAAVGERIHYRVLSTGLLSHYASRWRQACREVEREEARRRERDSVWKGW